MVGGALITFGLPYIFEKFSGDGRALYGQYYDLNNILSIFSMVMVTGVMQSVSKFVAESPDQAGGLVAQARKMMLIIGGLIGLGFIVVAIGSLLQGATRPRTRLSCCRCDPVLLRYLYGLYRYPQRTSDFLTRLCSTLVSRPSRHHWCLV